MIILTIDTDWAPHEATASVLNKVRALGIKTTVFFSAPSPVPYWPLLEVGAHPDLSRRHVPSDGGGPMSMATMEHDRDVQKAESDILSAFRVSIPEAECVRTHRFYWHSDLARVMAKNGFLYDSSMILPYLPGIRGFKVGNLTRWPVWASDHLHLLRRFPLDRLEMPYLDEPGLKIFCFHVTYLHLNVRSLADFNMISKRLSPGQSPPEPRTGAGIWTLFELLAGKIAKTSQGCWLRDIPESWLLNNLALPENPAEDAPK
ncbi:MAG: hypothetical protein LBP22_01215 [Deltaproteobacteria bacterium]|jgi:hypothetical protein|nr:hypothetical protein [Deltaproteobacteria bacterium]